jgi:putative MATE family efflux protein
MRQSNKSLYSYKGLIFFSIPSILSLMLEPLASGVDTFLIGRINTNWLASLAISVTIFNSFSWIFNFLIYASTESVSFSFGQKRFKELGERIRISLFVALILGVGSALLIFGIRKTLYAVIGASPLLYASIEEYFLVRLIGHPFALLYTTLISIFRGLGKVKKAFYLAFITTFLNIAISWFLLNVMMMGIKGAAIGTVISTIIGVLLAFCVLLSDRQIREHLLKLRVKLNEVFFFGAKSFNIFIRSFCLTASLFMSTKLASGVGVVHLAAHQILFQFWLITSFFTDGLATTATVLGPSLIARGYKKRWLLLSNKMLKISLYIGGSFSLLYLIGGQFFQHFFTNDLLVIDLLKEMWPLIVISQLINPAAFIFDGLLFGQSDFKFVRIHMVRAVFLLYLPTSLLCYFFTNLWPIWVGLLAINLYRVITGYRRTILLK